MPFDLAPANLVPMQNSLLHWGSENKRSFPWREATTTPYGHLVAEILLRKSRAASVAGIWRELIGTYPNFESLSGANEQALARLLEPLGLHRIRARALLTIGGSLSILHGGSVPQDEIALRALPHCGRYIANAVLCFAFGEQRPIVDNGINRFLTRHFGLTRAREIHRSQDLWDFAARLLPEGRAPEFNYALLDFSATVCTPRSPKCDSLALPGLPSHRRVQDLV
jgi:A/G-specific adenine glycosylase